MACVEEAKAVPSWGSGRGCSGLSWACPLPQTHPRPLPGPGGLWDGVSLGGARSGGRMGGGDAPSVRKPSLAIREGALGYRNPQPPPLLCASWPPMRGDYRRVLGRAPSPRGVCRPRGGAERRSLAYRGLRLPPPSRGRIPPGLAGVWRVGLPRACECESVRARGRSPAACVSLLCAVRAAVCRPLPCRVAAGGDVRARVGPLSPGGASPGSWLRDGADGRMEVQTGPRAAGVALGPGSWRGKVRQGC